MDNPSNPWIDWLHHLLCLMYRAWGGDCSDLGTSPTLWISTLEEEYAEQGAPTFETEAEKVAFLANLNAIDAHLDEPGNTLNPNDNQRLRTLVNNLRHDVQMQSAA